MPFVARRPLLRAAAVGSVAYPGARTGSRRAADAQQQTAQDGALVEASSSPPPKAAAATDAAVDRVAEVRELADLRASGALTEDEFQREKQWILG